MSRSYNASPPQCLHGEERGKIIIIIIFQSLYTPWRLLGGEEI
jgi:hypothetical protein